MEAISALNHFVLFSQFPPSLFSFSHSLSGTFIPSLASRSLSFSTSLWKILLILASGFEQKLWAKRLILALIPFAWTIIKVLNWFLGGYVFFIAVEVPAWSLSLFLNQTLVMILKYYKYHTLKRLRCGFWSQFSVKCFLHQPKPQQLNPCNDFCSHQGQVEPWDWLNV